MCGVLCGLPLFVCHGVLLVVVGCCCLVVVVWYSSLFVVLVVVCCCLSNVVFGVVYVFCWLIVDCR